MDGRTGLVDGAHGLAPEPDRAARGLAVGILVAVVGFWLPVTVAVARWLVWR